eukprot:759483-Hanusia_phi.AAC.2
MAGRGRGGRGGRGRGGGDSKSPDTEASQSLPGRETGDAPGALGQSPAQITGGNLCRNPDQDAGKEAADAVFEGEGPFKVVLFSNGTEHSSCNPQQHLELLRSQFLLGASDTTDPATVNKASRVQFELCSNKGFEELSAKVTSDQPTILQIDCPDQSGQIVMGKDKLSHELFVERLISVANRCKKLKMIILSQSLSQDHAAQLMRAVQFVIMPSTTPQADRIIDFSKHLFYHMGSNQAITEVIRKFSQAEGLSFQLVSRSSARTVRWTWTLRMNDAKMQTSSGASDKPWKQPRQTPSFNSLMEDAKARGSESISSLISRMRQGTDDVELQEAGCDVLDFLCTEDCKDEIIESDGIGVILTALKKHSTAANLQIAGYKVLNTLCDGCDETSKAVADLGGLDAIFAGMTTLKHVRGVQVEACDTICCILHGNMEDIESKMSPAWVDQILETLDHYMDEVELQIAGTKVLSFIAEMGGNLGGETRKEKFQQILARSMHLYEGSTDMQGFGCDALGWISGGGSTRRGIQLIYEAMTRCSDAMDVQCAACEALGNIVNRSLNSESLKDEGIIETAFKTAEKYLHHPDVIEAVLRLVGRFARREGELRIFELDGIRMVLKMMGKHPYQPDICGFQILRDVLGIIGPEAKAVIAEADGIQVFLRSLNDSISSCGWNSIGLEVLTHLAKGNRQNQKKIIAAGGVKVVHAMVQSNANAYDDQIAHETCKLLGSLATEDKELSETFKQDKGFEAIVASMNRFETFAVHKSGCKALLLWSRRHQRQAIRNVGGIEAIIKAMKKHVRTVAIHRLGCEALWIIAKGDKQSQARIRKADGVAVLMQSIEFAQRLAPTVKLALEVLTMLLVVDNNDFIIGVKQEFQNVFLVQAMVLHMKDEEVIHAAMAFLTEAAETTPTLLLNFNSASGLNEAICGTMLTNLENSRIQLACTQYFQAFAHAVDPHVLLWMEKEIEATVRAIRAFPDTAELLESAVNALCALAEKSLEVRHRVREAGGIEVVVKVMSKHKGSILLQEAACNALVAFMDGAPKNQRSAREAGAIEAIMAAMAMLESDPHLLTAACDALGALAFEAVENQVEIREKGGIKSITKAMKSWKTSPRLQEAACKTLGILARRNKVNQIVIREEGGMQLVVEMMKAFQESLQLRAVGCRALQCFAENNEENQFKLRELALTV